MLHSLSSIFLSSTTESGLCPASRRSSSASNRGTGSSVDSVPYSRFRCATSICCSACSSPNIAGAGALDTVAMTGRVVTVGLGTGAATGTELRPRELALVNPSEDLWKKSRGDPMLPSSSSSYQEGQQRAEVGNKNAYPLPLLHRSPRPPYPGYRLGLEQRLWGLCLRVGREGLTRHFRRRCLLLLLLIEKLHRQALIDVSINNQLWRRCDRSWTDRTSNNGFHNRFLLFLLCGYINLRKRNFFLKLIQTQIYGRSSFLCLSLRMIGHHTLPSQALSFLLLTL